jgi:hypothetical protein
MLLSAAEYCDVFSHNIAAAQECWRTMRTRASRAGISGGATAKPPKGLTFGCGGD